MAHDLPRRVVEVDVEVARRVDPVERDFEGGRRADGEGVAGPVRPGGRQRPAELARGRLQARGLFRAVRVVDLPFVHRTGRAADSDGDGHRGEEAAQSAPPRRFHVIRCFRVRGRDHAPLECSARALLDRGAKRAFWSESIEKTRAWCVGGPCADRPHLGRSAACAGRTEAGFDPTTWSRCPFGRTARGDRASRAALGSGNVHSRRSVCFKRSLACPGASTSK